MYCSAFDALHPDFINHLRKNKTALNALIYGHVIPKTWYSPGLTDGLALKTLRGNKVTVSVDKASKAVKFDKAGVTLADVTAGNGAVHAVDTVLFPAKKRAAAFNKVAKKHGFNLKEVCEKMGYSSFAKALAATKMDKIIDHEGTFTVFAPSNEAFDHPRAYPKSFSLEDKVRFHIGRGIVKASKIEDGDRMMSLLSKRFITFNVYGNEDEKVKLMFD